MKELKLQKLLGVIASAFKYLKNIVFFSNNTKYLVGGKFKKHDNHQDLIDINTIDITNLKTIDDVLDYVNKVGKDRFTNESISDLMALVIFNTPKEPNLIGLDERLKFINETVTIQHVYEPEPENRIKQLKFWNREIIVSDLTDPEYYLIEGVWGNILIELNEPLSYDDEKLFRTRKSCVINNGKFDFVIDYDESFVGINKIVLVTTGVTSVRDAIQME